MNNRRPIDVCFVVDTSLLASRWFVDHVRRAMQAFVWYCVCQNALHSDVGFGYVAFSKWKKRTSSRYELSCDANRCFENTRKLRWKHSFVSSYTNREGQLIKESYKVYKKRLVNFTGDRYTSSVACKGDKSDSECLRLGLKEAGSLQWRPGALKICILLLENVPVDFKENFHAIQEESNRLREQGIILYSVGLKNMSRQHAGSPMSAEGRDPLPGNMDESILSPGVYMLTELAFLMGGRNCIVIPHDTSQLYLLFKDLIKDALIMTRFGYNMEDINHSSVPDCGNKLAYFDMLRCVSQRPITQTFVNDLPKIQMPSPDSLQTDRSTRRRAFKQNTVVEIYPTDEMLLSAASISDGRPANRSLTASSRAIEHNDIFMNDGTVFAARYMNFVTQCVNDNGQVPIQEETDTTDDVVYCMERIHQAL